MIKRIRKYKSISLFFFKLVFTAVLCSSMHYFVAHLSEENSKVESLHKAQHHCLICDFHLTTTVALSYGWQAFLPEKYFSQIHKNQNSVVLKTIFSYLLRGPPHRFFDLPALKI